jgi:hypothetical protein
MGKVRFLHDGEDLAFANTKNHEMTHSPYSHPTPRTVSIVQHFGERGFISSASSGRGGWVRRAEAVSSTYSSRLIAEQDRDQSRSESPRRWCAAVPE